MPSRIISPAEFSPGLYVTVLDSVEEDADASAFGHNQHVMVVGGGDDIDRYRGVVLKVLSVDLPLVAFETLAERPWVLDTRRFRFMELKEEFVAAVRGSVNHVNENGEPIDVRQLARKHDLLVRSCNEAFRSLGEKIAALPAPPPPAPAGRRGRAANWPWIIAFALCLWCVGAALWPR